MEDLLGELEASKKPVVHLEGSAACIFADETRPITRIYNAFTRATQLAASGARSREITSLAGIFCSGSLTTANRAAPKASALSD
jgi:hypothetical protein